MEVFTYGATCKKQYEAKVLKAAKSQSCYVCTANKCHLGFTEHNDRPKISE